MMRFQSLPDILQSSILLFNFSILIVNIYCVVIAQVFKAKKKYRLINGMLLFFTSGLFFINSMAYFDIHRNYAAVEMPRSYNKPAAPVTVLLVLLFCFSVVSLCSIMNWQKNIMKEV